MLDCEGKEIKIGQNVVFTQCKDSGVNVGIVKTFTRKMVDVEFTFRNSSHTTIYRKSPENLYAI
jgi:RNase P/RNase MRP subunit p30